MLPCGRTSPAKKKRTKASSPEIPGKRVYMNIDITQYAARQGVVSRNRRAQCRSQSCDPLAIMSKKDRPEGAIGRAFWYWGNI